MKPNPISLPPYAPLAAFDSAPSAVDFPAQRHVASRLDYLLTYSTSGLTLLLTLITFRMAHNQLGEAGFAEFALMRRVTAFLVPLLSIGLAVSIAKCVARHVAENGNAESKDFLTAGIVLGVITMSIFAMAVYLLPVALSFLCTGRTDRGELVQAALPLVAGSLLTVFGSAYFRGRMWFIASNALQLVCLGVIPVVALMMSANVETFLCWSGLLVCAVSGSILLVAYFLIRADERRVPHVAAWSLLRCGLPRVPGDLAYYGLLAAPAVVAAHFASVQAGGDFAYALTWLTLLSQLVVPISTLLLPEAARLIYSGQAEALRRRLQLQIGVMLPLTCLLVAVLNIWGAELISLHLGNASAAQLQIVRLLLLAAIPLNIFICLRSVIDAGESGAVSPGICLVAFAGFCLTLMPLLSRTSAVMAVGIAFLVAVCMLAVLAVLAVRRTLNRHRAAPAASQIIFQTQAV